MSEAEPFTLIARVRRIAHYALMWGIRLTPLPWPAKRWLIGLGLPRIVVVASAVIQDAEGRTLMLRTRYSRRWILPGGVLRPGETPLEGVRRECREELGREPERLELAGLYTLIPAGELYITFRAAMPPGVPRLSAEHDAYAYRDPAHMPAWAQRMAADARVTTGGPVVRALIRRPRTRRNRCCTGHSAVFFPLRRC